MSIHVNRREFLAAGAASTLAVGATAPADAPAQAPLEKRYQGGVSPWPLCLDTATIRPSSLRDKIRIAAEAGYDAIEPWDRELLEYEEEGGDLEDLAKDIQDRGLQVPSVIGLWNAIPHSQEEWEAGLDATRNRMRVASTIGAKHVQVVPGPATEDFDLEWCAKRYHDLLEIGLNEFNINPAMVFVIFLPQSRTMGKASAMAIDADHPKAKIIPDAYHMYISGMGFHGLKHMQGDFIAIFQINDAPAEPSREELATPPFSGVDAHRVYPGDGILPLKQCIADLQRIRYTGAISLELYNPTYWEQDHLEVAKIGLDKTLQVIADGLG